MAESLEELNVTKYERECNSFKNAGHVWYATKYHWILFVKPMICFAVGPGLLVLSDLSELSVYKYSIAIVAGFTMVFSVLSYLSIHIKINTSKFSIVGNWLIVEYGILNKREFEYLLTNIERIRICQGLWARIFNYGKITFYGVGGSKDDFYYIERPHELKRHIHRQLNCF